MPRPSWRLLLLGFLLAAPARAEDTAWREAVWLQPSGADAPFPVLLVLPVGWQPGDAAVILLPDPDGPPGLRDRVMRALLRAEAAVLALDPVAASTEVPVLPPYPALTLAGQAEALRAALRLLRGDVRAGLLVVLGLGQAGALAAAAEPELAAAVALGGPAPVFRPGARPPAAEQWPLRARLLCAVLAEAAAGAAGPAATAQDCRAALLR